MYLYESLFVYMQVETFMLWDVQCPTSASSHHLAGVLFSLPNLTELRLNGREFNEEFFSTLNAKASTLHVESLWLWDVQCPTSASSHNLVDALCSMPNLTELSLSGKFFQEFYSTLNAKASTLQVQTLNLQASLGWPTSATSHYLVDALCSMPNLTELSLNGKFFRKEFYSTLNAKASTLQVQTLNLQASIQWPTSATSHYLVDALCSMPNLTLLTLRGFTFQEEFNSTLNAKASALELKARILWVDH
ncbi:uncharacterized protein LOC115918214 [Strongylocentrotus purpuratus]|uniref:Uncharacterized protein n=1 Tax=Strongylocentrotus purpuratus TaxID=7668 RepID=A0A7M7NFJ5_STRPU|nr:uncharacterized protein LOC115918214 [Strongylocentrotus purpuratus]